VIAGLASAATDFLFQVLAHYIFDDDIETGQWGKAVGRVDGWEVAKSGIFGLFGVNSKIEAIVNSLAYATSQTISIAKYYEQHPPQPPNPPSYNFNWAAKDFSNLFLDKLIEEGAMLLLGGAAGKAIGKAKEIPFPGWCKIARMLNRNLGTMIPGCFAAGTIVLTAHDPVFIEQLRPGDWVLTDPHLSPHQFAEINTKTFASTETKPELWAGIDDKEQYTEKPAPQQDAVLNIPMLPDYDFEEITPETWAIVDLTLLKTDGSRCDMSLLRPLTWLDDQGLCSVGDSTWLDLPDMRVSGMAQATGFSVNTLDTRTAESRALLERGYYPVLAALRHKANEVLHLRFTNGDRLTVTAPHPFWSLDRDGWLAAEKLNYGERVKTASGETVIDTMEIAFEEMPVFNLEVWKVHGYCVGIGGEVVHNGCEYAPQLIDIFRRANRTFRIPAVERRLSPEKSSNWFDIEVISPLKNKYRIPYNKNGFPVFTNPDWFLGPYYSYKGNGLTGKNLNSDYALANQRLLELYPNNPDIEVISLTSSSFKYRGNSYTWHHHEDGKTLMPVLQEVHLLANPHTGGNALLDFFDGIFKGFFPSPF